MSATFLRRLFPATFFLISLIFIVGACQHSPGEKPLPEPAFPSARSVKNDATPAYLNTEESLGSFRMPEGYHLEVVADDEMLNEPVALSWDGNGRMFVTQMETYMQTVDTTGEHVAKSRVLLLEDTDDDGRMDKRTVYIDSLMLPRMILAVGNELLVNVTDTYDIYAYKDTDNDGVADQKRLVYHANKRAFGNLEHQRSGLDWNLDNWIYVTVSPLRFKYRDGNLTADSLLAGSNGQWGITHDNYGRLFFARGGAGMQDPAFTSIRPMDNLSSLMPITIPRSAPYGRLSKHPMCREDRSAFVRILP